MSKNIMSTGSYIYLNLQKYNSSGVGVPALLEEYRAEPILPHADTESYNVTVDRFYIKTCILPVFKHIAGEVHTFVVRTGGTDYNANVAFPATTTYYNNISDVVALFNSAINSAATAAGAVGHIPTLTLSIDGLFSINTDATFRASYQLGCGFNLFELLNNFRYTTSGNYYFFDVNADVVTQPESTSEEFSPVQKIIVTSSMPTYAELTIPPLGSTGKNTNYDTKQILTDYKLVPNASYSPVNFILFDSERRYRWVTLADTTMFKTVSITIGWLDYENNYQSISLPDGSSADMKLVFHEKVDKVRYVVSR